MVPAILEKILEVVRLAINWDTSCDEWRMKDVLVILEREIELREEYQNSQQMACNKERKSNLKSGPLAANDLHTANKMTDVPSAQTSTRTKTVRRSMKLRSVMGKISVKHTAMCVMSPKRVHDTAVQDSSKTEVLQQSLHVRPHSSSNCPSPY